MLPINKQEGSKACYPSTNEISDSSSVAVAVAISTSRNKQGVPHMAMMACGTCNNNKGPQGGGL
jgi:hypothetical protein